MAMARPIRDKIRLQKKGMWMRGNPPLGYDAHERKILTALIQRSVIGFDHADIQLLPSRIATLLRNDSSQRPIIHQNQ